MKGTMILPVAALLATLALSGARANEADNTRENRAQQTTAQDQGNNPRDLAMTARIREAVMKASSLSTEAKNVKIITRGGRVVLTGPVNSPQERSTIGSLAEEIAGPDNVSNQLKLP